MWKTGVFDDKLITSCFSCLLVKSLCGTISAEQHNIHKCMLVLIFFFLIELNLKKRLSFHLWKPFVTVSYSSECHECVFLSKHQILNHLKISTNCLWSSRHVRWYFLCPLKKLKNRPNLFCFYWHVHTIVFAETTNLAPIRRMDTASDDYLCNAVHNH